MRISQSEAETRAQFIDIALEKAGWKLDDPHQVGEEIPMDGFDPAAWQAFKKQIRRMSDEQGVYDALPAGISDYVLYRENGEVLAVVEAKQTTVDPRIAEAQATFYVREFEKRQPFRPFAFLTNGKEIYFWDVGNSERRQVQGFFSRTDLERLLFINQHKSPLIAAPINTQITNHGYQIEAVRRISDAFERGRRKALIVMATGTGKTRVAMSFVDLFLNSQQA